MLLNIKEPLMDQKPMILLTQTVINQMRVKAQKVVLIPLLLIMVRIRISSKNFKNRNKAQTGEKFAPAFGKSQLRYPYESTQSNQDYIRFNLYKYKREILTGGFLDGEIGDEMKQ